MRLYGSEVFTVLGESPEAITPAVFAEEVVWAMDQECAVKLEDVVYRRLRIPWFRPEESETVAMAAAAVMAQRSAWTPAQQAQEMAELRARLQHDLSFG